MTTKSTVALAVAAGFLGGVASRYFASVLVHAQERPTSSAPPLKEIRAQQFVLVDEQGAARGVLGFEKNRDPKIELMNDRGFVHSFPGWGKARPTQDQFLVSRLAALK